MATRSAIIEKKSDGTYRGIYCHYDGYLSHNGRILAEHYQDADRVSALIDLGGISVLGERITPIGKHSFSDREEGTTVAYHRDRGEELDIWTGATASDVKAQIDHEYAYIFADGKWTVGGSDLLEALSAIKK